MMSCMHMVLFSCGYLCRPCGQSCVVKYMSILTVQCLPPVVWGYVVSTLEIELSVLLEKSSMRIVELSGLLIGWFMVAIAVTSLLVGNFCQRGCFGSYHRMFTIGQALTAA